MDCGEGGEEEAEPLVMGGGWFLDAAVVCFLGSEGVVLAGRIRFLHQQFKLVLLI